MTTVGALIREHREAKRWSQDDLAHAVRSRHPNIKLSGPQVSNYERGKHTPRLRVLEAIADALEEPLDAFRQKPAGDDEDEEESDLFRLANQLEGAGQIDLADTLRARARRMVARQRRERERSGS